MIRLRFAIVEPTPHGCITRFHDGGECVSHHHPNDHHYHIITARTGYDGNTALYALEHDVCHLIVEQELHGRPSRILHGLACGAPIHPKDAVYEELAAQTLQRWVRAAERPIVGGVDWDRLKRVTLEVLNA